MKYCYSPIVRVPFAYPIYQRSGLGTRAENTLSERILNNDAAGNFIRPRVSTDDNYSFIDCNIMWPIEHCIESLSEKLNNK